jgi:hypothetical protein
MSNNLLHERYARLQSEYNKSIDEVSDAIGDHMGAALIGYWRGEVARLESELVACDAEFMRRLAVNAEQEEVQS